MCVPSIAPTTWGNPHKLSNSATISFSLSSRGMQTYLGSRNSATIWAVLWTMEHTVEIPTPKRAAIVRYSVLVANLHSIIATCSSTSRGSRNHVTCFIRKGFNSKHNKQNVCFFILRLSRHQFSPSMPLFAASQNPTVLCLHQTLRSTVELSNKAAIKRFLTIHKAFTENS